MTTESEAPADPAPIETSAPVATSEPMSPTPEATPSSAGSAPSAVTQPEAKTGSLPTDTRSQITPSPGDPAAQPVHDWQKRYSDAQSYAQRLNDQVKQMQAKLEPWNGLDPNQVREAIEAQRKQAAQSQLRPWHPRHPESAQTDARLSRVKNYLAATRAIPADAPPELQDRMKQSAQAEFGVTREDAALYREHEQFVQGALNEFTRDPDSYIEQRTQAAIQKALGEYEQFQRTNIQTQQFLTDPKNAPVIKDHADDILWAMNNPQRREVGIAFAQQKAEIERLQALIGKNRESVATAEAQSIALKGKASVSRDPRVTPIVSGDPVQEAMAKGLKGDALLNHIEKSRANKARTQE